MKSSGEKITPEAFYQQLAQVEGPDLVTFAQWVVKNAPAHGLSVTKRFEEKLFVPLMGDFLPCYSAPLSLARSANKPGLHHLRKNRIAQQHDGQKQPVQRLERDEPERVRQR